MKFSIEYSSVVITPSVGSPKLAKCAKSIAEQTNKSVKHLIVSDGPDYLSPICQIVDAWSQNTIVTSTPWNTGANGFNGQRIYASYPHMIDADFVFFCDEDNWFEPNHVESMIRTIQSNQLDFAYSLRKIYSPEGEYLINDDCESLGKWPIWFTHDNPQYLVDTSSFGFTNKFIKESCHLWHSGPWGEDRRYLYSVAERSKWGPSGLYTLCYRLGGNENSVSEDFFREGNAKNKEIYGEKYPWAKH